MAQISDYRITDRGPDRFDLRPLRQQRQAVCACFFGPHRHKMCEGGTRLRCHHAKQICLGRARSPPA